MYYDKLMRTGNDKKEPKNILMPLVTMIHATNIDKSQVYEIHK